MGKCLSVKKKKPPLHGKAMWGRWPGKAGSEGAIPTSHCKVGLFFLQK